MGYIFPTIYDGHIKVTTPAGNRFHRIFKQRFDKKGNVIGVEDSKEKDDTYMLIQSNADSVDINVLMAKYQKGELDALNKRKALFIDTSDLPEDYFAMKNKVLEVEDIFKHLPAKTKEAFDNSVDKFIASLNDEDFAYKLYGIIESFFSFCWKMFKYIFNF